MDKRKETILNIVIREHIKTGAPVGSGVVVEKYKLDVSPATVRNEMAELEADGYIVQPHTSAGRLPTEKAYHKYLENLNGKNPNNEIARELDRALGSKDETGFKRTAKTLARLSGNAVFWAFHENNLYYTGISNLFSQPEFAQANLLYDISTVIDRLDEIIHDIFQEVDYRPQVLIGSRNPFSDICSSIMAKYKQQNHTGLIGIIGPMRMDYEKNLALVNYISGKLRTD